MARPLKIGFIQATNEIDVQWYRPLSFGYLKAYLDAYLPHPVDMQFLDTLDGVQGLDILGVSSTSQGFARAQEIARQAKEQKSEIVTVLGGHHVTYLPETMPAQFDIGVLGEGEQTFLELIDYFHRNGPRLKPADAPAIDGLAYHENGAVVTTRERALIAPLDRLPIPVRELTESPYMLSSRGCPYKCAFCSSSAFWAATRFFSAEYVVREIEWILDRFPDLRQIPIWDDLFIANRPRFRKIVQMIEERHITDRTAFSFSVRANLVDDELLAALKRMNVSTVGFGAESGSDRMLKVLNKGNTVALNQKAVDILHQLGVPVQCSFIVGSPGETEDDVRQTYEFILNNIVAGKLSASGCVVNILMPMPGTVIWDHAVAAGHIDVASMDWRRLSSYASYRNSTARSFAEWMDIRRENNAIYLAEDTLPQERLLALMNIYENAIKAFET